MRIYFIDVGREQNVATNVAQQIAIALKWSRIS